MLLKDKTKIVFIGDSITDCGASYNDPDSMGKGYPRYIKDYIYAKHPEIKLNFINKGVSGNRTVDLLNRWKQDVLDLKPDLLSICIGTNDIWRQFDNPQMDIVTADIYEENLRTMLKLTKKYTQATVLLLEIPPIETGFRAYDCSKALEEKGNLFIREYNMRLYKVASEFDTHLCHINKILSYNYLYNSDTKHTVDGVHPNSTGIMTFALSWLNSLNL